MFDDLELSNAPYSQLVAMHDQLEEYVLLDLPEDIDSEHLLMLFDLCERLQLSTSIQYLHNVIASRNIELTSRLKAAEEFYIGVSTNDIYINRFDSICQKLDTAIREEEDDNKKAIATFANYYLAVMDVHFMWLPELQNRIRYGNYDFLNLPEISELLAFDCTNRTQAMDSIQRWKDELLGRTSEITIRRAAQHADLLYMEEGEYANEIFCLQNPNFQSIRSIAIRNTDFGEQLATRGVQPLTSEHEMFVYMKSYGNMHYAKMQSAIPYINEQILQGDYELVDWGCGQGIATMSFIEYCSTHNLTRPSCVTLIEPSEIALSRAALHTRVLSPQSTIRTICSGFEELRASQVSTNDAKPKIHIFSNVLDVELYNIHALESVVQSSQHGLNYFLCVSPLINALKTARIRAFESAFNTCSGYCHLADAENATGDWQQNWTRVMRVFSIGESNICSEHSSVSTHHSSAPDVFISYSQKDYKDAQGREIPGNVISKIQQALTDAGISYWIDREGLQGGDTFPQRIAQHINEAKVFVFVSSANSNQSPWTMNEIATASAYGKTIIPFRLDDTQYAASIMIFLAALQYVQYVGNGNAMTELVRAVIRAI